MSAAARPVRWHASAGTNWKANTEILTYSRAKGLFVGIDLDKSWIERDKDSTTALYGRDATTTELLTGKLPTPEAVRPSLAEVRRAENRAKAAENNEHHQDPAAKK